MNLKSLIAQAIGKNLAAKDQTLNSILDSAQTKNSKMRSPLTRWVKKPVAIAAAAALVTATSVFVIATNLNKTANIELTASSAIVAPGDTVTLTVGVGDQSPDFKKGIVGMTMDIEYDDEKLDYVNETITSLVGEDFSVSANEADDGVITVLLYADNDSLPLSALGNGDFFSLEFTVKDDAEPGVCTFTPSDYKLADYKDDETGFELITATVPAAASITVAEPFTISTSVAGDIGGIVTGGGPVFAGSDATVTIKPAIGYYISSVLVDGAPIDLDTLDSDDIALNKDNSYTFTDVDDDHSVEVTFKKIFYMLEGGSIRLVDDAALRYITEVSDEFFTDLENKGIGYTLGTLFIPEDKVPAGGLTIDTPTVVNVVRTLWQTDFFEHTEGYRVMTGVLDKIPSNNYTRDLAGRVYLTIGGETIYTGETNVRSLAYVAYMAKNDPNRPDYSPSQMAKLDAYAANYNEQ